MNSRAQFRAKNDDRRPAASRRRSHGHAYSRETRALRLHVLKLKAVR
jgi:hypothetical protein